MERRRRHEAECGAGASGVDAVRRADVTARAEPVRAAAVGAGADAGEQAQVSVWPHRGSSNFLNQYLRDKFHLRVAIFIHADLCIPDVCFQGRLPDRQATEHAQGDSVHRQSVPQRQDLVASHEAQQTQLPGAL